MSEGYYILIWDGWGIGLNMINPRLHTEGEDGAGNNKNWFTCRGRSIDSEIINDHELWDYEHIKVIWL